MSFLFTVRLFWAPTQQPLWPSDGSMYMEFSWRTANVHRVLLATVGHPLPPSRTPQDGVWLLLTWWQASFIFTLQLFQATTFDLTICKAIAQSVWSCEVELHPTLNYANNQRRTTLMFMPGRNAWVRVLKWLQCSVKRHRLTAMAIFYRPNGDVSQ